MLNPGAIIKFFGWIVYTLAGPQFAEYGGSRQEQQSRTSDAVASKPYKNGNVCHYIMGTTAQAKKLQNLRGTKVRCLRHFGCAVAILCILGWTECNYIFSFALTGDNKLK